MRLAHYSRGDFVPALIRKCGMVAAIILVITSGLTTAQCSKPDPSLVTTTPAMSLAVPPKAISDNAPSIDPTAPPLPTATSPSPTVTPAPPTPTPNSAFIIPHSEFPIPHSAFITPHSAFPTPFVFGQSAGGRDLVVYRLGAGSSVRAIIGGLHGGYEANTVRLVNHALEYLRASPSTIPKNVTLYVVPLANPDGFAAGTDAVYGRMNANGVDLNRNWDYRWQKTATHGTRPVSAGDFAFSEPETAALRDLILTRDIEMVIFYHSSLGKVFPAAEADGTATAELAKMMAQVTGYRYAPEGVPGQITTGDAIDWLSTQGITAIEIELATHQDMEWERNLPGLLAFLNWAVPGGAPVRGIPQ